MIGNIFGSLVTPFMILLIVIALFLSIRAIAKRYKKVPPNKALIFYGRKYKKRKLPDGRIEAKGFIVLSGGGRILFPFVEAVQEMDTSVFQVELKEEKIPNKDNVKIKAIGLATCKISTTPEDLENAARAFLGKSLTDIHDIVKNILLGHLRSIIGKMGVEDIIRDRETFNRAVTAESETELRGLGIEIKTLVIKDIDDDVGYIDALGKGKTAEVQKEARVRVANAERDASIAEAEATRESRIKTTTAQKESETIAAQNQALIFQAQKERDVKIAEFKVAVDTKKAFADQAGPLSHAQAIKDVKVATAQAEAAEKEAMSEMERKEALRREQELIADELRPAQVRRDAKVVEAEGTKLAVILEAEGRKQAATLDGEGEAAKNLAILKADAEGKAAQIEFAGRAEGFAIQARLGGEADGIKKKAEAMKAMEEAAKLIIFMEKMPPVAESIGKALGEVAREIFQGIAAPLGSVDNVNIVDLGGGHGDGGTALSRYAGLVPEIIMKAVATGKAAGIDFGAILKKAGIDTSKLAELIGPKTETEVSAHEKSKSRS